MDFNSILQEAAQLKSAQSKKERKEFDSWPEYLKYSLFYSKKVEEERDKHGGDRVRTAEALLEDGLMSIQERSFPTALEAFQLALSNLVYVMCKGDWRKGALADDNISVHHFHGSSEEERERIRSLKEQLYVGIASASLHLSEYRMARAAATDAITLYRSSFAYQLRAEALVRPPSAGSLETNKAMKDLECALECDPSNKEARKRLMTLRWEMKLQGERDKEQFGGMFERGSLGIADEGGRQIGSHKKEEKAHAQSAAQLQIRKMEDLVSAWRSEGRFQDAEDLENHIRKLKGANPTLDSQPSMPKFDFRNPTPEMLEQARKMNLDLQDPIVQAELEKLQKQFEEGTEGQAGNEDGKGDDDFLDVDVESVPRKVIIDCLVQSEVMSEKEANKLPDVELRTRLREVLDAVRDAESGKPDKSQKGARLKWMVFTVVFLFFLYRLVTTGAFSGLFDALGQGTSDAESAEDL